MPPDSLKFIAVGGGKVSTDLIIRARRLGLPVYQGYGLSECGSVVALNTPQRDRKDSVGKILPHCKVSIDPDGEIKVAGAIFLGYLDSPETWYPKEVKTGDLGDVENSFLQVKGRKKNILITSFGRNISPEWVESEILSNLAVQQCMVVGDGRPYLTALISADKNFSNQQLERWIQNVNARLPDYARVQQWERIESSDFLGFLTENGRLKRSQIEHGFSRQIDRLYPNVTQYSNQRMVLP
ncbi:MAG: AMP-binding protein [Pseudomonadales bacterium]